ncbi:GrpB family protein [Nocardioides sp. Soil777]|uniref:GrpB family protein n=1 Tax=Nocardioides sp. Soil777 TaxID=1736409 RepID=UPI00138EF524|nr:GrpB family protein [Nocardioides sp. Soil777]
MLVPYDPRWRDLFRSAAAQLHELGNAVWVIEHIGSTAVPGMTAKPVIDLAVRVDDERDYRRHRPGLERGGWRAGSSVRSHPVMVREVEGTRAHIAHFFDSAQWPEVNQRLFRDWLLSHPLDARRYEDAKRRAAVATSSGRVAYNEGKTAFVQEIVDRARSERGLPAVNVSDK